LAARGRRTRTEPDYAKGPAEPPEIVQPEPVEPPVNPPVLPPQLEPRPAQVPEIKGPILPPPGPPRPAPGGVRRLQTPPPWSRCVAYWPDGRLALSAGADRVVRLWDVTTGREVRPFKGHEHSVLGVAFSPDGRLAASGGMDKAVRLWDVGGGRELRRC